MYTFVFEYVSNISAPHPSGVKWLLALDENCGPVLPDVTYRTGRPLVTIPSWANR